MKIIKIIISVLFISLFNLTISYSEDCTKYDKLSKEYAKCTSNKLKMIHFHKLLPLTFMNLFL